MKLKFFIPAICSIALVCASAMAQPMGGGFGGGMPMGGGMPPMGGGMMFGGAIDMTELAEVHTRQLQRELGLNEQQYKKILKINKKELDRRVNHYLSEGGSAGGFGGFGMVGGMPPMGGGRPGMGPGGMPPMGGGMPGMGIQTQPEDDGESPALKQARNVYDRMEEMEQTKADIKAQIKIEKKMQKILDEDQYKHWVAIQSRPKGPHGPQIEGAALNFDELPEEVKDRIRKMMEENGGQFPQGMIFPGNPQGAPQGAPQGMPEGFPHGNPTR